jgi:hypothetical protein
MLSLSARRLTTLEAKNAVDCATWRADVLATGSMYAAKRVSTAITARRLIISGRPVTSDVQAAAVPLTVVPEVCCRRIQITFGPLIQSLGRICGLAIQTDATEKAPRRKTAITTALLLTGTAI